MRSREWAQRRRSARRLCLYRPITFAFSYINRCRVLCDMSLQHTSGRYSSAALAFIVVLVVGCSPSPPAVTDGTVPGAEAASTTVAASATTRGSSESAPTEIAGAEDGPIYGYGDYSAYSYEDVPWDLVTAAEIACMQDQGWPVKESGPTGISFADVPVDQNHIAQMDFGRCAAGLNLPEGGIPSLLDVEGVYSFWVDVLKPCYEAEGYSIPDPPSLDTFVETYPAVDWVPWRYVTDPPPGLDQRCSTDPYAHDLANER